VDLAVVLSACIAAALAGLAAMVRYGPAVLRQRSAYVDLRPAFDGTPALPPARASVAATPPPEELRPLPTVVAPGVGCQGAHYSDQPPGVEPLVDPATGLATRRGWDEVFLYEEHRFARYGNSVTILLGELDGIDALASMLGQDAADRIVAAVAAEMRRSARDADFLARTGHARFAALLPETDEVAAVNYSERVCNSCDLWLEAVGVGVRLVMGWAEATAGGSLSDAMCVAYDRMNADRRLRRPRRTENAGIAAPRKIRAAAGIRSESRRDRPAQVGLSVVLKDSAGHAGGAA
jgi:diguanylate cyclase (GGDEF)-like protein